MKQLQLLQCWQKDKMTTNLDNSLTVPYIVKHILVIWPSNLAPKHLPLSRVQQTTALRPNPAAAQIQPSSFVQVLFMAAFCHKSQLLACKAENIYYLAFYRKSLLIPNLGILILLPVCWCLHYKFIKRQGSAASFTHLIMSLWHNKLCFWIILFTAAKQNKDI